MHLEPLTNKDLEGKVDLINALLRGSGTAIWERQITLVLSELARRELQRTTEDKEDM